MRVLHASDSPEHAFSEALAAYRHFAIPLPLDLHIVVRAVRLDMQQLPRIQTQTRFLLDPLPSEWTEKRVRTHDKLSHRDAQLRRQHLVAECCNPFGRIRADRFPKNP
ncbi:MAG: hypothetical protein EA423_07515 [Phycisphaerales bacterium]|nr:MAG: hypothetical protein EA423_07515 [Phycisphaerales bacterium]